jgi:hypothetical protein
VWALWTSSDGASVAVARANIFKYVLFAAVACFSGTLGVAAGLPRLQILAIAAAAIIVVLGVFSEAPELLLLAFLVVRPAVDGFVFTSIAGFTLGQVWGVCLVAATVVYLGTRPDVHFPAPLTAFLVAYVALTFTRPQLSVAADSALKLASWLLLAVAIERIARSRRGQNAILTAIWASACCLLGVIAVVAAQGKYGSAYYKLSDTTATYLRPHTLAQLAVLILPFVLMHVIIGRRIRLSIIVAGFLGLGVLLSLVRTAYLAVAMILAAYVFVGLRTKALRVRLSLVAISIAVGFTLYFFWGTIARRLTDLPLIGSFFGTSTSGTTASGRLTFWRDLLTAGSDNLQHTLLGRGAGASAVLNQELFGIPIGSHNDFIEFFVTGGILLLGVYLAFLFWILSTMIRLYRDSRQSTAVHLCSILLIGAFFGYIAIAATDGITLAAGSVVMAVIVGITQGMLQTPGDTAMDPMVEARSAVSARPSTG